MPMNQTAINTVDDSIYSEENRKHMAILTMNLFKLWGLSNKDQLNLLGLSASSRAVLTKYRNGAELPATRDLIDRVSWFMVIHKALGLLYPDKQNADLKYDWVNRRNTFLKNFTPIEVMKDEGLIGVAKVARYLDSLCGK